MLVNILAISWITAHKTAIACWSAGWYNLNLNCGNQIIHLKLHEDLSFYGLVNDVNTCDHVDGGCKMAITAYSNHAQDMIEQCEDKASCSVQIYYVYMYCDQRHNQYSNYEQVSYTCADETLSGVFIYMQLYNTA